MVFRVFSYMVFYLMLQIWCNISIFCKIIYGVFLIHHIWCILVFFVIFCSDLYIQRNITKYAYIFVLSVLIHSWIENYDPDFYQFFSTHTHFYTQVIPDNLETYFYYSLSFQKYFFAVMTLHNQ